MYDQTESLALKRSGYIVGLMLLGMVGIPPLETRAQHYSDGFESPKIIRRISQESERLELTTNSSRILTLDKQIPRVQVNNPELVAVTPLSATQVQISAKKPGVTQVNLWDEDKQVHTIDIVIYGDLRELEYALKTQFPNSSVKVRKYSQSLLLTGYVDSPDHVVPISQLAEDYAPKVITNMQVGGVQQVLLKVKVFEVSRTRLRALGTDFAGSFGDAYLGSGVSGILSDVTVNGGGTVTATAGGFSSGQTVEFGVLGNRASFFGFIEALQQNNVAKILAEPNIVSVSGRPAQFLEGGELPILVPQSLGTSSIEFKPFGTQVDFLPIVLGNGNIRLEVRPRVSALDPSIGIQLQDQNIPGFRVRQADTAVEMRAGQTFALAGLIQHQTEAIKRGIPYLSDLPVIGAPFRKTEERTNEIELLILVTPEFVDALDPNEVPACGPGMGTRSPTNHELYLDGFIEVPTECGPCATGGNCGRPGCGQLGSHGHVGGCQCQECLHADALPIEHGYPHGPHMMEESYGEPQLAPPTEDAGPMHGELRMPVLPSERLPAGTESGPNASDTGARSKPGSPAFASRPQPNYQRQITPSAPPRVPTASPSGYPVEQGLIGPMGYDVDN